MRANMSVGALQLQYFDKRQADAIRSLLMEPAAMLAGDDWPEPTPPMQPKS